MVFFGLIALAVTGAGVVGVSFFGPEKEVRGRSQLATNPPAPTVLPSLLPEPSAEAAPPATPSGLVPAEPASPSAAPVARPPPVKPKRRAPKGPGGKAH